MNKKNNLLQELLVAEGEREVIENIGRFKIYAPDDRFRSFLLKLLESSKDTSDEIDDIELIKESFICLTNIEELDKEIIKDENFKLLLKRGTREFNQVLDKLEELIDEESIRLYKKLAKINNLPDPAKKVFMEKLKDQSKE